MNNNKFYKIGVAVSVLLIGVIVACIVIAQKQDDKVAKAEDFPSVSSSTNVVENEVNVAEQTDFEEIAKVEENKNTENDSKNVTTKNNKTENTTSDKSAQNTTSKKSNDTKNQNKKTRLKNALNQFLSLEVVTEQQFNDLFLFKHNHYWTEIYDLPEEKYKNLLEIKK